MNAPSSAGRTGRSAAPARSWPLIALAAIAIGFVVLGHDGRRVAQMLVLLLPALAWMAWPVRSTAVHRARRVAVLAAVMAFAADGVVRAYLLDTYQSAPDGAVVLGALANTNARESGEYLQMHWRTAALWCAVLGAAGYAVWRLTTYGRRRRIATAAGAPRGAIDGGAAGTPPEIEAAPHRAWLALLLLAFAFGALAHASKPWRRLHPVVFWTQWADDARDLRTAWADQQRMRDAALQHAHAAAPQVMRAGPSTVVLVITDSINRDNLGLYGYGRNTTPRLAAAQRREPQQMTVLRHAWSVDASTLPAMANMMRFGQPTAADAQHLLPLARAAGYKVWWMSNHDDVAIEQQHARLADEVEIVNRVPGRASASLDGELLDCVQEALEDPAERKLIVVHLLGAHPHYRLRFPGTQENPFDDTVDAVESGLIAQGRPAWVRRFRQDYDNALLYHDFVVAETLQLTRTVGRLAEYRAWFYVSDHGQEVGHGSDHVGHSPSTASGYRIPAIVWRNQLPADEASVSERPFRADWLGWTVADLLALQWKGQVAGRDVLADDYRWEAPVLPVKVRSYLD
ncbi:heptose-I-phosphate ethanolaminephosphotransferase [Pseudacidovorax intermedius]|uniref:Heptose-I-phosphate ethanolaminephosphotransferase n=2 Tax=Pseudacidovorax intermedius TaxID=433924 RepID=A0A370FQ94_9BURK|nr:heptose-I-phosphate ethanolaminephosphotransferase [Pseudacidovorax intermedius]